MDKLKFRLARHSGVDKAFFMIPPKGSEITILIDFDDVDHPQVNKEARAIVEILNQNIGIFLATIEGNCQRPENAGGCLMSQQHKDYSIEGKNK